jgi:two-component system OmpR family response regulator
VQALSALRANPVDLVIVDVNMPRMDGYEFLERLRASGDTTPTLFLTARGERPDVAKGLTIGADDYVTKPFGLEELLLRIQAILRRSKPSDEAIKEVICGPISINDSLHQVKFDETVIDLSPTEYRLLQVLIQQEGKVVSKRILMDNVWAMPYDMNTSVVDTYISYLRKKLHRDGFEGIKTIRGVGFKIVGSE